MRVTATSVLALVIFFVAGAAGKDDKAKDAAIKAAIGKWGVEKAELGGKDSTEIFKSLVLDVRDDGKYTVKLGDQVDEGTFTVNTTKDPKEMDIHSTEGPNKGKTIKAIYKLDGDTMTVCYALTGDDRPKAFESKPDTSVLLVVYKRKKD